MTKPRPVVALLGAAPGARQALAHELIERIAQTGVGAGFSPEFTFELTAGKLPALTLLIAPDAGPDDPGLRERLARERVPYSVLYGDASARLASAWQLLQPLLKVAPAPAEQEPSRRAWSWSCDKCSDPACEHRLFQDLLAKKPADSGTEPAP
ncbi:MAG TPA: hypothetical protein VLJ19_14515 [Variovorax sp.]|nr:hypothetical protein [Variovorax sp.]